MASQLACPILSSTLVFLLILFTATHAQCPAGCTCNFEHGTVECRGMVTLTTNMFPSNTSSIKFIHLYAIEIPADMFSSYPNLKMIDIFQCNFAGGGIRRNAFRNLQNLDYIRIRTSRITTIEDGVFNNLRNVSEITLFGVTTDTVTSRMFDDIDGVKLFKISRCMFRYVKERAFTNIQNVGEFIFEQNSRDLHVSKNAFSDFGNIGRMQICPTKFQSVNARSFSNLTGIARFEFCKNRLGQVPGETFWNIDANLIIFQRNQFNDLHSGTIDSLVAANPNAVHMIDNTFRCNCSVNWMITEKRDMMLPYLRNGTCFDKPGEVTLAEIGSCGELTTTSSTTAPTTTMSTTTMSTTTVPMTTASTTSSAVITMAATTTTTQNSAPLTFSVLIPILAASSVSVALLTV